MISAEHFSRLGDLWRQLAPVSENHVRWINQNLTRFGDGVRSTSHPRRRALLSEVAFRRAGMGIPGAANVEARAREFIAALPRGGEAEGPIKDLEELEIEQLHLQLADYTRTEVGIEEAIFFPQFAGCGIVDAAKGDILKGSELIEVKAVERSFRSSDLRQLLTYCALAYGSKAVITTVTLLNPKKDLFFREEVTELASDIGAGPWVDLMLDIRDAMSRDGVSR